MFSGKPGSIAAPHGGGQVTAEVVGVAIPCSSFVVCIYNGTCAMSGDIIPIAQVSQSGNFVKLNLGDGEFAVVPSSRFSQRPYFLAAQDRNGEPPLFDTFDSLLGLDGGLLTLSQGDCYRIEVVAAIPAPPQRHDETAVWEHTARHNGIELQDVDVSGKMEFDELCGILSVKGVAAKTRLRYFLRNRQQQRQQRSILTYGLPELGPLSETTKFTSNPSVPTEEQHAAASLTISSFAILTDLGGLESPKDNNMSTELSWTSSTPSAQKEK